MPRAFDRITIQADRDKIWALLTTPADIPRWYAAVDAVTASEDFPATGSSFEWRATLAVIELSGKSEVADVQSGSLIRYTLSGMLSGTWTWTLREVPAGLQVEYDANYHLTGGVVTRLLEPAVHQINIANARKSLEALKHLAEN
jgi:uncharacterized protein YndB with AHSA1/START domain